jgi:mono/diheme cytochrome c family protein
MLYALSTGHEIGLASVGAAFVIFALVSSFVLPRFVKDFPTTRGLPYYLVLSVLFFVAMMGAVLVFGREKKGPEAQAATTPATTATTGAGTTTTGSSGLLTSGPYANGDATAGKTVFSTAGCGACHTLQAAGTSAAVGPDLDHLASYAAQAKQSLGDFTVGAILHPPPAYVPPGFPTTGMPTTFGTSLTQKQIADLVAFVDANAGS